MPIARPAPATAPTCRPPARPATRRGSGLRLTAGAQALWLALAGGAFAQTATEPANRVEITGSLIKRVDAEGALPVQVISRDEITKAGATTAAEIVAMLPAVANSLTDGISMANAGYRDQIGFNAANLRGIGTGSTLVLLNGRRMANYAAPGDDAGVDLNTIPAAAIERVEVLLDGASAVYGSDAIGGVMNFITRRDWQGVQLDASLLGTQEGGAGKRTASIAGGIGDIGSQRFNVFAVLDLQKTDRLGTSQREFIDDLKIPERLPHLLSSAGFPGNIRLSSAQRRFLQGQGFSVTGDVIVNRTINLSAPDCQAPHTLYLPDGIGGVDGCTFDFMRDVELSPESDKLGFLSRGVFQLNDSHQLYAELSYARARTHYVGTSNRIDADVLISDIPELAATGLGGGDPDATVVVRTRLLEAGPRNSEVTSTGRRLVLGASGVLAGWDYDTGFNHSVSTVSERAGSGYLFEDQVLDGFLSGLINPFGPSGAAGLDALSAAQVDAEVRRARGTMVSLDGKASRPLMKLGGGDMALAVGAEVRRETTRSSASDLLASGNILGDGTDPGAQFIDESRRVWAVYGEVYAPITRTLEMQFALRHDHYQQVGNSTNPKFGVKWQPAAGWLVRGSMGTGFRAPTVNDLYRPAKQGQSQILVDPVCMAENDNDLSLCADFWDTLTYANDKLKPERSRQFSLGLVFEANRHVNMSIDYWNVQKKDLISTLGDQVILENLDKYEPLVHRFNEDEGFADCEFDPDDSTICFIELQKENRGRQKTAGLDITIEAKGLKTAVGTFGVRLVGTRVLTSKEQTGNGDPYISNLGRFVTDGVVQRWRHRLTFDWANGPWGVALTNHYIGGHTDQNNAVDNNSGTQVPFNRVKAYSLWDLSAVWDATPQLTLRAGIKNLANTSPPFSNQQYFFLSGYDPSYTDPRGRLFHMSASYAFR